MAAPQHPPRDCLTRWPDGDRKNGISEADGERALLVGRLVRQVKDRTVTTNTSALARQCGVDRYTINRIIDGLSWPKFHDLYKLATAVGVEPWSAAEPHDARSI